MSIAQHTPRLLPLMLAIALSACGGGGGGASIGGTGVSQASASGTVQGFGSVLVNGCRWSTLGASVHDDLGRVLSASDLSLGMQVQIDGSSDAAGADCSATDIEVTREYAGSVSAVTGSTFTVLSHVFTADATTVFKGFSGATLASMAVGDAVEVYGLKKADGSILASLVEKKANTSALSAGLEARGVVSNLDTTNKTFKIDALTVNYTGVSSVPAALTNGIVVKATGTGMTGNTLNATALYTRTRTQSFANGKVEIKGYVQDDAADSNANTFTVNGVVVDVSQASFKGLSGMSVGAFVEVNGQLSGGVLMASQVETEQERSRVKGGSYEFYGVASDGQLAAGVLSFTLQGQTVRYSTASDVCGIAVSGATPYVEVKGSLSNGVITASKLECPSAQSSTTSSGNYSGNRFETSGAVQNLDTAAMTFKLGSLNVKYQNAQFEKGNSTQLANGKRLEVKGKMDANQQFMLADKIEFDDDRK